MHSKTWHAWSLPFKDFIWIWKKHTPGILTILYLSPPMNFIVLLEVSLLGGEGRECSSRRLKTAPGLGQSWQSPESAEVLLALTAGKSGFQFQLPLPGFAALNEWGRLPDWCPSTHHTAGMILLRALARTTLILYFFPFKVQVFFFFLIFYSVPEISMTYNALCIKVIVVSFSPKGHL